jgi:flavin reductase (DIM6/NTAB) family NADH-FMN oxidoreductase RutF
MPETPRDRFDSLAAAIDPTMAVLTTVVDGERAGCLIGFHSQCGIDPPRYAVWLSEPNRTTRLARSGADGDWFALHLLGSSNHTLAQQFGGRTGDQVDTFAGVTWSTGPGQVPLLDDCPARLLGRRVSLTDVGADHLCLVLEPVDVKAPSAGGRHWLRLADVADISAGHPPDDD